LALAISLRPGWLPLLLLIVVAMAFFAVLDVREVFHQLDEDKTGLAMLAALVAALQLAAAGLAGARTQRTLNHAQANARPISLRLALGGAMPPTRSRRRKRPRSAPAGRRRPLRCGG
jgi:hypothetical protein